MVEVSSEICLVGISLQRMVEIYLQGFSKLLWEIIPFTCFGRESLFKDSLVEFIFINFWLGKCLLRDFLVEISVQIFLSENVS